MSHSAMIATVRSRLDAAQASTRPKYRRLRDAITEAIAAGEWAAGARLPTESELSRVLPYSLGTIQKAYGELVKDWIIVRARGRGSFVAAEKPRFPDPWHCRFLGPDGAILPVHPTLIGHAAAEAGWVGRGLFGPDPEIVRIDRSLSIGGAFDVLSRFYVRAGVAQALLARPLDDFKSILRDAGIAAVRIEQAISTPDQRLWRALGLPGRAHILIEATAYAAGGDVAYVQELFVPANRRKLLFDTDFHIRARR